MLPVVVATTASVACKLLAREIVPVTDPYVLRRSAARTPACV
jgi:hypothetical protein